MDQVGWNERRCPQRRGERVDAPYLDSIVLGRNGGHLDDDRWEDGMMLRNILRASMLQGSMKLEVEWPYLATKSW